MGTYPDSLRALIFRAFPERWTKGGPGPNPAADALRSVILLE